MAYVVDKIEDTSDYVIYKHRIFTGSVLVGLFVAGPGMFNLPRILFLYLYILLRNQAINYI